MLEQLKIQLQPRYADSLKVQRAKWGYSDEVPFLVLKEKTGLFGWFGRKILHVRIPEEYWSGDNIEVMLYDLSILQEVADTITQFQSDTNISLQTR